eukprot:NODE_1702_length_1243_cov_61.008961_g1687_i0.p1 GENE.NODE_1702_length_1243_cov_61.008961_g1687_i0~~NODE_1702_length_1243_cov_61.008961_g1687_i0.p1  ORF type:complete len:352 (+),score=46.64 NODE_1702_length_1243_cov_61.008961_g1687_i0:129-1184(+)
MALGAAIVAQATHIGVTPLLGLAGFVVVSFIAMGMTGFGPAIVFHVAWQLLVRIFPSLTGHEAGGDNEMVDAVMLLAVNAPFSIIPLYISSRKDIKWDLFWWLFIPKTTCFCLGTELLLATSPTTLKRGLGFVFFVFAIWLLGKELSKLGVGSWLRRLGYHTLARWFEIVFPPSTVNTEGNGKILKAGAAACGAMSGLLNGMFGTPGPPLLIFFALAPGFNSSAVRGTSTACHFFNLPIRLVYFFFVKKKFDATKLIPMLVVIVFGQIGLRIGDKMHSAVRETVVQWSMLALLFGACALMMDLAFEKTLPLFVALFFMVVLMDRKEKDLRRFLSGSVERLSTPDDEVEDVA